MAATEDIRLADRLAVRQLIDEYALAVDARDAGRFASLFTEDGVLAVIEPGDEEPALLYRGDAELRAVMKLLEPFSTTFHVMANHTSRLDGDTAGAVTYCLAHHLTEEEGEPAGEDTLMLIRYEDRLRRAPDGWRFERRDVLRQWTEYHAAERARLAG